MVLAHAGRKEIEEAEEVSSGHELEAKVEGGVVLERAEQPRDERVSAVHQRLLLGEHSHRRLARQRGQPTLAYLLDRVAQAAVRVLGEPHAPLPA